MKETISNRVMKTGETIETEIHKMIDPFVEETGEINFHWYVEENPVKVKKGKDLKD